MEPTIPLQPLPTQPVIPVPPTPVQPKNNSLFIIIAILALGIAGFFAYQNRQLKQQIIQAQPTPSPLITPTNATDPTVNWKTYSDPLNIFEVQYPNDWITSREVKNKDKYTQVVDLAKTADSSFYNPDEIHALWIKLIDNPGNNSLEQIIKSGVLDKNYGTLSTMFNATNTNIPPKFMTSTMNGYHIYQPDGNWPSAFGIKTVFIKNPTNNSFAWLNLEPYDNNNQNLKNIFNQILFTFKFTNAKLEIPNTINKIFTAVNQAFGSNITPTIESQFYSLKGFVNQQSWKLDVSSLLTDKSQFTILFNALEKNLKQDINSAADGVGQSVQGYENDQIYCFLLRGFNASDYISCVEK